MKRYIRGNADVFKLDTDISYYNNFLNEKDLQYMEKSKNRTGKIVYMTPAQYYKECATKIFKDSSVEQLKKQRRANSQYIEQYERDMAAGDTFPLCYLNYADHGQEGLHRMMAAGNVFGWDTEFPVLVVSAVDGRTEELNNIWRYWNDAIYQAQDYTYSEDNWEQEFVEEVEWNLEHRTDEHHDVVIVSKRDKDECAREGMDYAIEIALAEFQDIMRPVTIFEPKLKPAQQDDEQEDNIDDTDDIDWDMLEVELDDDLATL